MAREFFVSGGTLPLDSESYIERSADKDLLESLAAGKYCYVLNSRQMGKSSLSVRTIARLNERGVRTAFIDLTQIGQNVNAEQWYAGLTGEVGRAFGLSSEVLKYFIARSEQNPMQRFFGALREIVLERIREPIVLFIDEIDGTRNLSFDTDEFFAGIRECFNRRVHEEGCRRLTFCLIGVAVPNDLIRNPSMTPFNIGERIRLQDFNLDEIQRFGAALGPSGDRLARRVHYWTNGQPFLTQSLCREIASDTRIQEERDVDALVQQFYFGPKAVETNLHLADVANRALWDTENSGDPDKYRANLMSAYERAWKGGSIKDDEANRIAVVLKLSGLLRSEGVRLVVRNRIYHRVFDRTWIQAHMPGQELFRQRQSFRRGLFRGVGIAALIGGIIGTLALVAVRERQVAMAAQSALENELYVAEMNSLRLLEGTGDSAGMAAVLERSRNNSNRGFEWNFWLGRLHDSPEEYTFDYSTPGKYETGIVSQDGRQICIEDTLADVAAIVDRQSKRVLATVDLGDRDIIATKSGIVAFRRSDTPARVTDMISGRVVCNFGTQGYHIVANAHREQSNFLTTLEVSDTNYADQYYTVWNLTNGNCAFRNRRPPETISFYDQLVLGPLVSRNGSRYMFRRPIPASPTNPSVSERLVVWDAGTNKELDEFPYLPLTSELAMSESGRLVAYRDEFGMLRVRDVDQRREIYSLDTGVNLPVAVALSADDRVLVCVTSNGLATVRAIPSGRLLAVRTNLRSIVSAGKDSEWLACSSSIRVLNISVLDEGVAGPPKTVAADGDGAIRIQTQGPLPIDRLSDPDLKPMSSIALPKGAKSLTYNRLWCLAPETDGTARLVSVDGTSPSIHIQMRAKNLACGIHSHIFVVLSNNGRWYGISGLTGAIIWANPSPRHYSGLWMSRDSSHLMASTAEGYIISVDPLTGKELRRSRAHHLDLSSFCFSRDGRQIATGGADGMTVLWDINTLEKIMEFRSNAGQRVWGVDISPDGTRLATCNSAGDWLIWDTKTGQELTEIRASNYTIRTLTFTSDGQKLVTAGDDGKVRIWKGLDHDPTVKIPIPPASLKNVEFK